MFFSSSNYLNDIELRDAMSLGFQVFFFINNFSAIKFSPMLCTEDVYLFNLLETVGLLLFRHDLFIM